MLPAATPLASPAVATPPRRPLPVRSVVLAVLAALVVVLATPGVAAAEAGGGNGRSDSAKEPGGNGRSDSAKEPGDNGRSDGAGRSGGGAEGPGYDGRADKLVLTWQRADSSASRGGIDPLIVFGRGFRGHSEVALRVGAAAERLTQADEIGSLRIRLVDGVPPGTTVVAVGQTPSGSKWILLGAVPSEAVARGPQTFVTPGLASLGVLALAMTLIRRRSRPGRPGGSTATP